MSETKEWWILEYPGLGILHRNYGVSEERQNFEAMFSNGALTNFWSVVPKSDYDALQAKLDEATKLLREAHEIFLWDDSSPKHGIWCRKFMKWEG